MTAATVDCSVRNVRISTEHLNSLLEVRDMLSENIKRWRDAAIEEGLAQGIERGREQRLALGIEQGIEQGIERGKEQGATLGQREALLHVCALWLERRFGESPERRERLETLSVQELHNVTANILDAASEKALFESAREA